MKEEITYYDLMSKKKISKSIANKRFTIGLKNTIGVYMTYPKFILEIKKAKEERDKYWLDRIHKVEDKRITDNNDYISIPMDIWINLKYYKEGK